MSRKVKFTVSIKELAFTYEGDADTGEDVQRGIERTLSGIVGMQNRAMGLPEPAANPKVIEGSPPVAMVKRKRRKSAALPNGDGELNGTGKKGVPGLLQKMIDEGFMSEERTVEAVRAEMSTRGHVVNPQHASTILKNFAADEKLLRKKNDEGLLVYWAKS